MSRPRTYVGGDSAETVGVEFHGVLEGKEQYDAVRLIRENEIQIQEPKVLVPRVLPGHGRQEYKPHSGIHCEPIEGR